MNNAVAEIRAIADGLPDSGFGSAIAAPESRRLEVYWHGRLPESVRSAIERQRALIPIVVRPAKHTERQLLLALAELAKHPDFLEIAPRPDSNGLTVRTWRGRPVAERARQALSDAAVAYTIEGEGGGAVLFSRQNDSSPWWAGARTTFSSSNPSGGGCTTGFAVNHGGTTKLLSAAHCGANGDLYYDGVGDTIGYAQLTNNGRDVQLINARGQGRMWDGGYNSTVYKGVQAASPSLVGNWVCTSGSRSGVRCGIQVKEIDTSYMGAAPLVRAERTDYTSAAGTRDSGGPVFSLPSPDTGRVIAKGIISRGDTTKQVTCVGENWDGRVCTWRFYYADVVKTLAYYGATIVTG